MKFKTQEYRFFIKNRNNGAPTQRVVVFKNKANFGYSLNMEFGIGVKWGYYAMKEDGFHEVSYNQARQIVPELNKLIERLIEMKKL